MRSSRLTPSAPPDSFKLFTQHQRVNGIGNYLCCSNQHVALMQGISYLYESSSKTYSWTIPPDSESTTPIPPHFHPPFSYLGTVRRACGAVFACVTDPIATIRACRRWSCCIPIGWTGGKGGWSRLALPIGEHSSWSRAEDII